MRCVVCIDRRRSRWWTGDCCCWLHDWSLLEFKWRDIPRSGCWVAVQIKDKPSTPVELQAVKLLATYLSNPSSREVAAQTAAQWLEEAAAGDKLALRVFRPVVCVASSSQTMAAAVHCGTSVQCASCCCGAGAWAWRDAECWLAVPTLVSLWQTERLILSGLWRRL